VILPLKRFWASNEWIENNRMTKRKKQFFMGYFNQQAGKIKI